MDPKIKDDKVKHLQSDVFSSFVTSLDHGALLRSIGHRFRDGRPDDSDPGFHVYRERRRPGFGSLRTFQAGMTYHDGTDFYGENVPYDTYNWRPCLADSFESYGYGDSYTTSSDPPLDASYEDYVLDLNGQGTDFIKKYRPGNPVVNLGQFFGELHDLPRLPIFLQQRAKHFRDLGSEYLNIEFGWRPFVSDLVAAYRLQQTIKDRLSKLIQNNGIPVRKRSKRVTVTDHVSADGGVFVKPFGDLSSIDDGGSPELTGIYSLGPVPLWYSTDITGSLNWELDIFDDTTTWECGTFLYYVPDIGSDQWTRRAINALFGANTTPSVLYELYPWSWLVNWFTNVGDIFSNLSTNAVDNEVLTDCYAMREVSSRYEVTAKVDWNRYTFGTAHPHDPFNSYIDVPAGSDELSYSRLRRSKLRRQSSPFGFGIAPSSITLRQKAILAALAISRWR